MLHVKLIIKNGFDHADPYTALRAFLASIRLDYVHPTTIKIYLENDLFVVSAFFNIDIVEDYIVDYTANYYCFGTADASFTNVRRNETVFMPCNGYTAPGVPALDPAKQIVYQATDLNKIPKALPCYGRPVFSTYRRYVGGRIADSESHKLQVIHIGTFTCNCETNSEIVVTRDSTMPIIDMVHGNHITVGTHFSEFYSVGDK